MCRNLVVPVKCPHSSSNMCLNTNHDCDILLSLLCFISVLCKTCVNLCRNMGIVHLNLLRLRKKMQNLEKFQESYTYTYFTNDIFLQQFFWEIQLSIIHITSYKYVLLAISNKRVIFDMKKTSIIVMLYSPILSCNHTSRLKLLSNLH